MPRPAIETNSILTLALSVVAGQMCSLMPGVLAEAVQGYGALEALPLVAPHIEVPVAFGVQDSNRPSRTLQAAIEFAHRDLWREQVARYGDLALSA